MVNGFTMRLLMNYICGCFGAAFAVSFPCAAETAAGGCGGVTAAAGAGFEAATGAQWERGGARCAPIACARNETS
jgi:hypothetical protein